MGQGVVINVRRHTSFCDDGHASMFGVSTAGGVRRGN